MILFLAGNKHVLCNFKGKKIGSSKYSLDIGDAEDLVLIYATLESEKLMGYEMVAKCKCDKCHKEIELLKGSCWNDYQSDFEEQLEELGWAYDPENGERYCKECK